MNMVLEEQTQLLNKFRIAMSYFNSNGRRKASADLRIFSEVPQNYYRLSQPKIDYENVLFNSKKFGNINADINLKIFAEACESLKNEIQLDVNLNALLNGVHIPFIVRKIDSLEDLGKDLEDVELPAYQKAFNAAYPEAHFKAVLQSNSMLAGSISLDSRSRYDKFLEQAKENVLIGWYFPQALQEFDIASQRQQMTELPGEKNICLSGGIDAIAALIGTPGLLISDEFYAPILCLSSYVHSDPRLVMLMKSYGPHMEFWCMTQMLSKNVSQVSEQWSGGLTIFRPLD